MSDSDEDAIMRLEPEDLDGHTIDELEDYLDRGRQPQDPSIDDSPACRIALDALERLREVAGDYLDVVPSAEPSGDQEWIARVLGVLPLEARAGRGFPLTTDRPHVTAEVTEGALRGLVRAIGDGIPGFLIGSVRFDAVEERDRTVELRVDAALRYGVRLADVDATFRTALERDLPRHLPFAVRAVHLRIVTLIEGRRR